ncbi:hypothetical protein EDB92DRAFT_1819469 [Lactarius akahatsu]|uniref:Uncharacterized protein n=1 Tax=Lactarius akahatsu TaxID=416441 RepID=A0AAD4LCQ6_9AGAM|nr:hypothetical protein EDB92DRAFT_1819469 [Lactarius akahatsu]
MPALVSVDDFHGALLIATVLSSINSSPCSSHASFTIYCYATPKFLEILVALVIAVYFLANLDTRVSLGPIRRHCGARVLLVLGGVVLGGAVGGGDMASGSFEGLESRIFLSAARTSNTVFAAVVALFVGLHDLEGEGDVRYWRATPVWVWGIVFAGSPGRNVGRLPCVGAVLQAPATAVIGGQGRWVVLMGSRAPANSIAWLRAEGTVVGLHFPEEPEGHQRIWRCRPSIGLRPGLTHASRDSLSRWWSCVSSTDRGWFLHASCHLFVVVTLAMAVAVGVKAAEGTFATTNLPYRETW